MIPLGHAVVATVATTTPWWVAPAVVAALIAATAGIITMFVNGRRARVDRQRVLFGEAFGEIAAYKEFVYIVRRRRHDEPEAERVRISTELSAVQRKLNQLSAVLKVEAPTVGDAFDDLLRVTRRVAGGAIRDGWNTEPITADSQIHVDVDLTDIDPLERNFLLTAGDHLSTAPATIRRTFRAMRCRLQRRRQRADGPHAPAAAQFVA